MAGWRQAVALAMTGEEIEALTALSRSRTEPAGRVSRAAMLLGYREKPSFFAVGRRLGVHHQTVQRCVERAMAYGALAALDDRPRPGKEPTITPEAKAWLVSLACDKAKEHGYPHELWTTRLLARHARERGPAAGHQCLARLAQGTVCKLLGQEEIKPHKVRYYLERRDAEFEPKMAEVLCVYREVQVLKKAAAKAEKSKKPVAIVSYDEKPGIQAIATTAPDLPPVPGRHASFARDHEYKRHGTLSLLAGIDLLTGKVHALVRERHRSREFIEFLKLLDRLVRRACWTAGWPDMRQYPVGEPAATAAWNFGTPRRRSSLKRLGPFFHCRHRYIRNLRRIAASRCEYTRGLAETKVSAPADEVWRQIFDQLRQADPTCPACLVPDLRLELIESFRRDAPLTSIIRDAKSQELSLFRARHRALCLVDLQL